MFKSIPKRHLAALTAIGPALLMAGKALVTFNFKRFFALLMVSTQLLGATFTDRPVTPYQDRHVDLSRFVLTFADEFDHGFDDEIWQGHYVYGDNDTQPRDTAYWNRGQVSFTDDGCLKISVSYKEDGPAGAHYYSYGMETNPNKNYNGRHCGFEQLYGYFEVRCILPKGAGLNPAFWLLTDGMWDDDTDGGISGCEIDVFETPTDYDKGSKDFGSVYHTIHVDAYGDAHKKEIQGWFYADDPYNQFNTYGVEWNEDGYIFYINGVETARTDFGGVCQVPLYLILSVGVNEKVANNSHLPSDFIVDYVRAYQYKDKMPIPL
ncbi:MAG: glycoside hydrolase family 16 protein [Clostridia bacterium]|nr:glycoside hydrolase family 16 protein [Clostridia bacterium]